MCFAKMAFLERKVGKHDLCSEGKKRAFSKQNKTRQNK